MLEATKSRTPRKRKGEKGLGKDFAEFFAGIGLIREALKKSRWNCTYANDIDPKKKEIYDANFSGKDEFDLRDVGHTEEVLAKIGTTPFLVTASFPCVDLSVAGHYRGFKGKESSTFFGFLDVVRSLPSKPKMMLLENVMGLLTARQGKDFRDAVTEVSKLGYRIDAFVIDARSFVPQSRKRVFIVGIHESVETRLVLPRPEMPEMCSRWMKHIRDSQSIRPSKLEGLINEIDLATGWVATQVRSPDHISSELSDVIDLGNEQDWWEKNEVKRHYNMMNDRHRNAIDQFAKNNQTFVGTGYRRKRKITNLEVRFDGIAGCLRTPRGGSARQIVVAVVNGELKIRWMSAMEYARLQGVGEFRMVENERQMLFGFGDAVCVPVIEWIDKTVLTPIFNEYRRNEKK